MKKRNIILSILICTIVSSGLLYASPKSITVINTSGKEIQVQVRYIQASGTFQYEDIDLTIGDNRTMEITAPDNRVIQKVQISNLKLYLEEYSEPISIVYDGKKLLEQSEYNLETQPSRFSEKIAHLKHRIAANLAVAWQLGGTILQRMRTAWQNRSRARAELSVLAQGRIYNKLDTNIAFSAGMVQSRNPKTITPQESKTFGLKNNNVVYIYKPEDTKNPINVIDLQKYIDNPKPDSELEIYIEKRYNVTNKLFGWMPNWSDITYRVEWVKYELYNIE